jgi:hypothetical protein
MGIIVKFLDVRLVASNQFDGKRKRRGGVHLVVEVKLMMHGTALQDLSLQSNSDGDHLFLFHGAHSHRYMRCRLAPRNLVFTRLTSLAKGPHPTTLKALRQAAACGAGSGGS